MASNASYDSSIAVAILLPSVGQATTLATNAPPAGTSLTGNFAAEATTTMPAANAFPGPVPEGVPIVVSSSLQGGTELAYRGGRRELRLATLSVYALRHLEKAEAFEGATIEVYEYKSKEKSTVSSS
jgi:hypothetical protein